jgi:hypothetical protein
MRPRVKPLHSRRGARKGKVSRSSARISVLQPCKSSTRPAVSGLRLFVLSRCGSELTRLEGLSGHDSWHTTHRPTHNGHALFSFDSSNCLRAFWSCDSNSFFSHMPNCPRSAATLADQFSRNSAHETRKIFDLPSESSSPGAIGPYNGINPLWRRRAVLRVMAARACVSYFVPQPLLQCECLWAAGERKRGAAVVVVGVDLVHRRLTAMISTPTESQFHCSRLQALSV